MRIGIAACLVFSIVFASWASSLADDVTPRRTLALTATAYNSVPEQTNSQPNIAAWGDSLQPGMKVIAVSRDLLDLGAIKVRVRGGEIAYAIPELPGEQVAPSDHLRRVLGEWVVEVAVSANIVVVRTPPGSAHVVAAALDRAGVDGALGTVAGDDTLMIVARADHGGDALATTIRGLAGLDDELWPDDQGARRDRRLAGRGQVGRHPLQLGPARPQVHERERPAC